ncbi:MAG: sugar ABC transporter permease [Candidatus Pacebacteria bacterium]|nr:sugar ABC transporter permease [Candidatus Paceibacterota bacterium]
MMESRSSRIYYYMIIPAVVLFFTFHTYPALQGVYYSFTDSKGYGTYDFVGLKNYINLFKDGRVLNAYIFTFKFAVISTILVNIISLILAIALNSKIIFQKLLKSIYFLPLVLSVLIIGYIFNYIFTYLIPDAAKAIGIEVLSKSILGNPELAWIGIVFVAVWQACAFNTIIYLAGLQTIPIVLYEAANIDGASGWQQFRYITFVLIAPFFTVNMVLAMKNFLMVFAHVVALTGGGPGRATESISLLIYDGGFNGAEFAYQSANAVIYFFVILVISIIQIKFLQKREINL